MLPLELLQDKYSLLYTDNIELIKGKRLNIDKRKFDGERYYNNVFYSFPSTEEYILKYNTVGYTKREIKKILEMLDILTSKQKNVKEVDFPIGYYLYQERLSGLIVPYYPGGISYEQVLETKDINELNKYYAYDEDGLHNTFLLLLDILNKINEMFDNGIYYTDIDSGNIVLTNNQIKLIDFDYRYVNFNCKDDRLFHIMSNYAMLIKEVFESYGITNCVIGRPENFSDAKIFTKKIENRIRKR